MKNRPMPGKQARALCPVCQEPMPPDETACDNCGAFVIDEAVVRLSRAFGIDREKALQLFEAGFRHPQQLGDRDVNGVLERQESGLLFICTNCGSFVAGKDNRCSRCDAEFEVDEEEPAWRGEEDILDLVLCPNCGADNTPDWSECEICGEPLGAGRPVAERPPAAPPIPAERTQPPVRAEPAEDDRDSILRELDELLASEPERAPEEPQPVKPAAPVAPPEVDIAKPSPVTPQIADRAPRARATPREPRGEPASPKEAIPPPTSRPRARPEPSAVGRVKKTGPVRFVREAAELRLTRARRPTATPASGRTLPPPEATGAAVVAAAVSLYASRALGVEALLWGLAFLLATLTGYALAGSYPSKVRSLRGLDVLLLAGGASLGVAAAASLLVLEEAGVLVAAASALSLAWATRRLLTKPGRALLAAASGVPLIALAVLAAMDGDAASRPAWGLAVLAMAPWPAAIVVEDARRGSAARSLRRELATAERYIERQDYAKSAETYDRAIALSEKGSPEGDLPWYGKGATLVMLGRYEEALRAIDRALDINPHNEVAWLNKGNALTKMGKLVDGLRCFNAAIKVNPKYEVAWNNKGNALARLGRFEDALRCYERALEIDPGYQGAWVNKGYVLAKLGRYEEAASCADRVLRLRDRIRPVPG